MTHEKVRSRTRETAPEQRCSACASRYDFLERRWRCDCGRPLTIESSEPGVAGSGVWRYADVMPPISSRFQLTLGEPVTPVLPVGGVLCKLDHLMPSGSFKDRGAATLVSWCRAAGVLDAVVDSSGNAGAAMSAYFGAAGIALTVYVPEGTSSTKQQQARRYGSTVVEVPGTRADASEAARAHAAERGAFYASHSWSPLFLHGLRSLAAELVDQLGPEIPPIVVPTGAGTALLGLFQGFKRLVELGRIDKQPRLVAAQARVCSPIVSAFKAGRASIAGEDWGRSIAEGINIVDPPRGSEILEALRTSGGTAIAVDETELVDARDELWQRGVMVETTSATAFAAAQSLLSSGQSRTAIALMTGSGLKETMQ
jgi:threonine synthase